MQKKWFRTLFTRRILVSLMIILQIGVLVYFLYNGSESSKIVSVLLTVLSLFVCISIMTKRIKTGYKVTWIFLILVFPVFGGLFYLLFSFQSSAARMKKIRKQVEDVTAPMFFQADDVSDEVEKKFPSYALTVKYLQNYAGFPVYKNTTAEYLSPGEKMFEKLVEELEKAEKYIFLEYFIIQEGKMWNTVLEILKRKVKQGVEVRLMYDDMGCFLILPNDFAAKMKSLGIKCTVFNPFRPVLTATQNNRDHRKIASIDGKVAFTGGINLADEYINEVDKHGHWKDAAVMVRGDAAWSFTLMFLRMWSLSNGGIKDNIESYCPEKPTDAVEDGYYQPYSDSPINGEHVCEHVYLQVINSARKYVYINTPYLIVDENFVSALTLAAKSGVDVRICTPHRWDKKMVHITTRSFYRDLIEDGVKIYEYSNGFIHSKTFVSDDLTATVGTANLDFRSLYLHFECGVRMYDSKAVMQVKDDFLKTLERCKEITKEDCKANFFVRLFQIILRIFAPLM